MWESLSSFWFNKLCFGVHLAFGTLLLIESVHEINVGGYSTKLDVIYTRLNGSEWPDRSYHVETIGTFNIVGCLAAFELITSLTHLWYMSAFEPNWYLFLVGVVNPFARGTISSADARPPSIDYRYYEYSITAPLMILIITVLFGIRQIFTLIAIFALMHVTMLFGVLQSWSNDVGAWPHFYGWIPYIFAWFIIFINFAWIVRDNDNVPEFVWIVLFLEFFMFSLFGFVQYYYEALPKLKGYSSVDRSRSLDGLNNMLSLLSKVLLTCILYFNFISLENM